MWSSVMEDTQVKNSRPVFIPTINRAGFAIRIAAPGSASWGRRGAPSRPVAAEGGTLLRELLLHPLCNEGTTREGGTHYAVGPIAVGAKRPGRK